MGRPLLQEEQCESSAKSSEHAASAKHQLYIKNINIEARKQLKSDVKSIRKAAEQDCVNILTLSHQRWFSSSENELITGLKAQKQYSC